MKAIFGSLQNDHGSEKVTNCERGYQHYDVSMAEWKEFVRDYFWSLDRTYLR